MDGKGERRGKSGQLRLDGSMLHAGHNRGSIKDEELRKMQDQIKAAYTRKALQAQLAERQASQLAEQIETRVAEQVARYQRDIEQEERRRLERQRRKELASELKLELERQLAEKLEAHRRIEEAERRERGVLIAVDRLREREELANKLRAKSELAEQLALEQFIQRELREVAEQRLLELEARLAARERLYAEELGARLERAEQLREEARERRERMVRRVAETMLELETQRDERRRLLAELVDEEARLEARTVAREAELRHRQRRQEMRLLGQALEEQMRFEEECKRCFVERERELSEAIMARVALSEQLDRLTTEARRRRCADYRAELEQMMENRRVSLADELASQRQAVEEELRREHDERQEAKSLRMQLLRQHAEHVADFMSEQSLYAEERVLLAASRNTNSKDP